MPPVVVRRGINYVLGAAPGIHLKKKIVNKRSRNYFLDRNTVLKLSSFNKFVFSPVERNFSESSGISSVIDCLSVADDNKNDKMFSLIDRKWIWISQNLWLWLTFYVKTFIQQQVNMLWNDCGESERNQTANQLDHHHNRQSFGKYLKIYGKMKFGEWIWGDYVDVLGMDSSGNYKARNDRESWFKRVSSW